MTVEKQMIEVRHLMRKHILLATNHGAAVTFRCMECGRNGSDRPDGIFHEEGCRLAALLLSFGDTTVKRGHLPPLPARAQDATAVGTTPDPDTCFS